MALLLSASTAGILLNDGGEPYFITSLRGEEVEIYGGEGLYAYDNVFKEVAFRSFDWVGLVIILPLFILGASLYRRGRIKGGLLLAALFTYLAYIYLIGVMGNAFNILFLVWTALFSVGLWGLLLTLADMDSAALPGKLAANFPRKSLAVYVVLLGIILFLQYLSEVLSAYATDGPPASLDHYTTLELAALEFRIMIPLHFAAGILLWKRRTWGYILAILLAFAAFMTFISLSLSLLQFYFLYQQGSMPDLVFTILITLAASAFTILIFMRVRD
jgi:hypothetical protein